MFAKLINHYPSYAPRRLRVGETWVYNPTVKELVEAGYMTIIESEPPEADAQHYTIPQYSVVNGKNCAVMENL